jgi:hypothetical protein
VSAKSTSWRRPFSPRMYWTCSVSTNSAVSSNGLPAFRA